MRIKNTLGLILADRHDVSLGSLTDQRTLGAVHFGGRYRLIDFALSNMVNSGIYDVGLITQSNYRSLLEHISSGRPWDLARKNGGLTILPPFVGEAKDTSTRGTIDVLFSALGFLEKYDRKYVVLTTADIVGNIDYQELIKNHIETGADITVCCKDAADPQTLDKGAVTFVTDQRGRVTETIKGSYGSSTETQFLGVSVIERQLLIDLIKDMHSKSKLSFIRHILQEGAKELHIQSYHQSGYLIKVNSLDSYYEASMELLKYPVRQEIFRTAKPVLTKVRDEVPAKYGINARVVNSIVADGAIIEGTIQNCVIFRGVRVAKGAVVKDSILMQGSTIGEGASLSYIIADRDCVVSPGRMLCGYHSYPMVIAKESKV